MAATQQMLDDAQAAYHRLLLGESVAEFRDQNGETVRYTAASRSALATYIEQLKAQLGLSKRNASAPMRVWF